MNGALVDLACLSFGFKIIPIPLNSTSEHASYIINHSGITHLFVGGENAEKIWNDIRNSHYLVTIAMSESNQINDYSMDWDSFLSSGDLFKISMLMGNLVT